MTSSGLQQGTPKILRRGSSKASSHHYRSIVGTVVVILEYFSGMVFLAIKILAQRMQKVVSWNIIFSSVTMWLRWE